MSIAETFWLIFPIILFGGLVAVTIAATELERRCTRYRKAWKEAMDSVTKAHNLLANQRVQIVGLQREVIRLKTERDRIARGDALSE